MTNCTMGCTDAASDMGATNTSSEVCKYCGMPDCPMHGPGATTSSTETPAVHQMAGVPPSIAIGGLVFIILASHALFHFRFKQQLTTRSERWSLFRLPFVKTLVRRRGFPMTMQGLSVALFVLVIATGLFGNQRVNIAPVLTWTWWWALLIFFVLGAGKFFCAVCPWEAISSFVSSLSVTSRRKVMGFERPWPRAWRNIFPAMLLFVLLTWFELGLNITHSPMLTATMGVIFVGMAVLTALLFERRAFCRYVCLVGRIQGLYALFSPVELRPTSTDVCRTCVGKECYHGNGEAVGCPTSLFPGSLKENTYCTLCTECVRSCPHDNIDIGVRPLATDLLKKEKTRWDEAALAIVLLALTSFHGMTMTPSWLRLIDLSQVRLGLGETAVFTLLMAGVMLITGLLFWGMSLVAGKLVVTTGVGAPKIFKMFAYSIVPIALFYHLAHNSMHFFMEAQNILPLLSDPFGWGWNLFGTAGKSYLPFLTLRSIWWIQIALIAIGHIYAVVVADRMARRLFDERSFATRSLVPLILTMVLYSSFSVWLIAQPMEMRSGM